MKTEKNNNTPQGNEPSKKNGKNKVDLSGKGFGTFKGVFLPSALTIFGVVMYLRSGWVVGNVGIALTILIVTISSAITLLTALSIASIATNMKIKVGGAYYMVSRTFGVEAGAAVGIPLFLAQAFSIAFYLVGFAEAVHALAPSIPENYIGIASLLVLTVVAYISASFALKVQLLIFLFIMASLVSFFMGGAPEGGFIMPTEYPPVESFWVVFAVFFPAVTGILAGVSMSGDLKNPSKSIPSGTFAAILAGYIVYIAIPVFLGAVVPKEVLRANPMIMRDMAYIGSLILLGLWGATLSSALGSLLGAPRTLQSLGIDRVVPQFLGKGFGKMNEPRLATALTFGLAFFVVLKGNLNSIAPILTMFFLTTYGTLNFISGIEGLMSNPSWRPSFKTPWFVSMLGAFMCLLVMLMINPGATILAFFVVVALYIITAKRSLNPRWADIRRALLTTLARFAIYKLSEHKPNPRSWRPNIFLLSGSPMQRWHLIEFADAITHGKSLLTVAAVIKKDEVDQAKLESMESSFKSFLKERNIPALAEVTFGEDFYSGAKELVKSYGLGPMAPNTFLFGETEKLENFIKFAELIQFIHRSKKNVIICRDKKFSDLEEKDSGSSDKKKEITCWWGGKQKNAGLMLTLGYMIQTSPEWRGSELCLKTLVTDEQEKEHISKHFGSFVSEARITAKTDIIIDDSKGDKISTIIRKSSQNSDLVILGMRPPKEDETPEDYAAYYSTLIKSTEGFPRLAIVLSAEDLNFKEILS